MTHAFHNFLCLSFLNYFQLSQEFKWEWMTQGVSHCTLRSITHDSYGGFPVILAVVLYCPLSYGASLHALNMERKPAICISRGCLECSGVTRGNMPYKLGSELGNVCK